VVSEPEPLLELLHELKARDYKFVAVTPATHASVLSRRSRESPTLRDIFGWNMPFGTADLDLPLFRLLQRADVLEPSGDKFRSRIRVATLDGALFLHSSFPTDQPDSVFFGPDTYRFAQFVGRQLPNIPRAQWIVDMGAGSGAGGILAARDSGCGRVSLVDVNPAALRLAAVNAAAAGIQVEAVQSGQLPTGADLVLANPPYMMDSGHRAYRDGGALFGGAVALDWVEQALERVRPDGAILLYTGAAVVDGESPLAKAIEQACERARASLAIEHIDPDVFGYELAQPAYRDVERITVIGAVIRKSA
jgi:methylase of polypeptide subunit release factors